MTSTLPTLTPVRLLAFPPPVHDDGRCEALLTVGWNHPVQRCPNEASRFARRWWSIYTDERGPAPIGWAAMHGGRSGAVCDACLAEADGTWWDTETVIARSSQDENVWVVSGSDDLAGHDVEALKGTVEANAQAWLARPSRWDSEDGQWVYRVLQSRRGSVCLISDRSR